MVETIFHSGGLAGRLAQVPAVLLPADAHRGRHRGWCVEPLPYLQDSGPAQSLLLWAIKQQMEGISFFPTHPFSFKWMKLLYIKHAFHLFNAIDDIVHNVP